jgi:hypothetical protein
MKNETAFDSHKHKHRKETSTNEKERYKGKVNRLLHMGDSGVYHAVKL